MTLLHSRNRSPRGVAVQRSRDLEACDVFRVGGLRYTSLARTVCDLGDGRAVWDTLALVDDAVAIGANPRWLHQRAAALAAGRDGVVAVREATRPGAAAELRSWLERASAHVYRVAGIPDPEWNVPVDDAEGQIGVVDALWRVWWVIGETEGLRFHTTPRQRRRDARRFNRLDEAGYTSRRFVWEDVVVRPVDVAATVLRALRAAGADVDLARLPRRIDLPDVPYTGRWAGCVAG